MSEHPDLIIDAWRELTKSSHQSWCVPTQDIAHMLKLLDHQDAQIAALRTRPKGLPDAPVNESVCQEADRIVSADRQAAYGHPIFNFTRTARLWEVIFDLQAGAISPEQVGLAMIAVKLARELHHPKRDNLTDICGFAKTVQMVHEYKPEVDT